MYTRREDGLYPVDVALPCETSEISVSRYSVPVDLGSPEADEAAARILIHSTESGEWHSVSSRIISAAMHDEVEEEFVSREESARIRQGIEELRRQGFLRMDIETEIFPVYIPTPRLIKALLKGKSVEG